MLTEVIGPEKFFAAVAFSKFVHDREMMDPLVPVLIGCCASHTARSCRTGAIEISTAVTARIGLARSICTLVERLAVARQGFAAPAMASNVKTILVSLRFVLVLEPVSTVQAFVLLFRLVRAVTNKLAKTSHKFRASA